MKLTFEITWELTETDGNMPEIETARKAIEDAVKTRCLVEFGEPDIAPYTTRLLQEQVFIEGVDDPVHIRLFGVDERVSEREAGDVTKMVEQLKEAQQRWLWWNSTFYGEEGG